jgi:hypothetical protein
MVQAVLPRLTLTYLLTLTTRDLEKWCGALVTVVVVVVDCGAGLPVVWCDVM